jgi:5-methylcytosine-specific restriction protein A
MSDFFHFDGVDETEIRREKDKARKLRQSRWWQQKLANGTCYYCGKVFKPGDLTMDHIVPLARGGRSTKDNLVACCKECNTRKKTLLPMEWEEYMRNLNK